jgi:chromosome partitioning protein
VRKIAVINYKGGTGKTSTVVNVAHSLALKGYKVLIIDTDPQGSASHYLGVKLAYTLYDVLLGKMNWRECITRARINLDIIGSNERLFPAEMSMAKVKKDREKILLNRMKNITGYDFVLLDCAPSMSLLNQNTLLFADEVLLPVSMEYLALIGVKQLLKNIRIINKMFSKNINISKVVPTFFDVGNKKSKDVLESLHRVFPGSLSTPIRRNEPLSEAPGYKKTIFEYSPKSKGAYDYAKLTEEVLNGRKKRI